MTRVGFNPLSPQMQRRKPASFRLEQLVAPPAAQLGQAKPIDREMLSPDQARMFKAVLDWMADPNGRQWLTLGGLAGTGKTTLVSALAHFLTGRIRIAFATFTGMASNVLARKLAAQGFTPDYCGTLHRLLYKWTPHGFVRNEAVAEFFELVVVDEASMVGAEIWTDLVLTGLPILCVGDHGQLPPVGNNAIRLMESPDLRLEQIHRQAADNPIIALAHHVRAGKPVRAFRTTDDRVQFINRFDKVVDVVADGGLDVAAICYFNKTRIAINAAVRRRRGFSGNAPDPNDIVICLKNNPPMFNGMRGIVRKVAGGDDPFDRIDATVEFPADLLRCYGLFNLHQFNRAATFNELSQVPGNPLSWSDAGLLFDFGYALTCHKFQGSQAREVVVRYETLSKDSEDTRRRWGYTAFTRAAERLYIIL